MAKFLENGWKIAKIGISGWMNAPPTGLMPLIRERLLALETGLATILHTTIPQAFGHRTDPLLQIWARALITPTYAPLCTHLPISEHIRGVKFSQLKEDWIVFTEARQAEKRERENNYHRRYRQKIIEEKRYYCKTCDKAFSSERNLRKHGTTRCHLDKVAGIEVQRDAASYEARLARNARIIAKKRFYCPYCDKAFHCLSKLKSHKTREYHRKRTPADVLARERLELENVLDAGDEDHDLAKPFICGPCGRSYSKKGYLERHEGSKMHQKNVLKAKGVIEVAEKRFPCKYCPNTSFDFEGNLKDHMATEVHQLNVLKARSRELNSRQKPQQARVGSGRLDGQYAEEDERE